MKIELAKKFQLGDETYYLSWDELTLKPVILDIEHKVLDKGEVGKEKFESIVNACILLIRSELNK